MASGNSTVKASRSAIAEGLFYLDGKKVSFDSYPFHYAIYDGNYQALLKITARQVGKTVSQTRDFITLFNGRPVPAKDITVGTRVASLDGTKIVPATVTAVIGPYKKELIKLTTRQGHVLHVGPEHPIKVWAGWRPAGELKVGDRVAAVRKCGEFTGTATLPPERIRLTAYMIGDGYIGKRHYSFTSVAGPKLDEFVGDALVAGSTCRVKPDPRSRAITANLHTGDGTIKNWFISDGLHEKSSYTKRFPEWVWDLSEKDSSLFLNRLWSTDGCVRYQAGVPDAYDINYCSVSEHLIRDVQALLWKFGIPSTIRTLWPKVHKLRNNKKYAYNLRVETIEGAKTFLIKIGALGKSERLEIPNWDGISTTDTIPSDVYELIFRILSSGGPRKRNRYAYEKSNEDSLAARGLRVDKKKNLTHYQLKKFVQYFREYPRYDQRLVSELEAWGASDVCWDKVVGTELLPAEDCVDFEVTPTHNFIVGGVVTHNSTMASNFMIAESISIPFFKTLYVAPTKEQTSKFSNTRLSKTLNYSPLVRKRFLGFDATDNVLSKILSNGSEISLSYASDDPDRIRGVSADRLFLDEVQDMDINAVLPVVKETTANSDYGFETFCGTPKSSENGIEYLWQRSTQTEWIMPCAGCNKWNFITTEKSIGLKGPICVKCGHLLNPREGKWYDMNPGSRIKGFHISQPMLPKNCENPARWERILDKKETYPPHKLRNEVLGVSDSIGTRLLSLEELQACCDPKFNILYPPLGDRMKYSMITGGVDWSGGGSDFESRTVCWVWGLMPDNRLKMLYYRIFPGRNQVEDVEEVIKVFETFRCQMICGDAGGGAVANSMVQNKLGEHRFFQLQYGSTAKQISWNGTDRFVVDKTGFIDTFMLFLKKKGAIFGNVKEMQPAFKDILAEYEEVTQNGMGRKIWRHSPTQPDDSLHAALYAWVAMRIARGELQLYKDEIKQD